MIARIVKGLGLPQSKHLEDVSFPKVDEAEEVPQSPDTGLWSVAGQSLAA